MSKPTYICEVCGVSFSKWWSRPGRLIRFCSNACRHESLKNTNDSFWAKVDKSSGCWTWTGHADRDGYGRIMVDGRLVRTHRLSYEIAYGRIPDGMFVCHTCDNPRCVRPDHLWLGTHQDNVTDMVNKGRQPRRPAGTIKDQRGDRSPVAKLTWAIVDDIRRRYAAGESPMKLAKEYGIAYGHVFRIIHHTVWKTDNEE